MNCQLRVMTTQLNGAPIRETDSASDSLMALSRPAQPG
jgi:hypothetical protein